MHVVMLAVVIVVALGLRAMPVPVTHRWPVTLLLFLWPPCVLVTTALTTLWMCPDHFTLVHWDDGLMHGVALCFLGLGLWVGLGVASEAYRLMQQIQDCPEQSIAGHLVRVMDTPRLLIAQVGFWNPQLVVSQGLLMTLSPAHLAAALCHEQAHGYYRDTFWFFWLGCLKRATGWLPNTEHLWQELLVLRELRADQWTAERVDPLLLAESLILVVQANPLGLGSCSASMVDTPHRLQERVEAILNPPPVQWELQGWFWVALLVSLAPLLSVGLCH